MSKTEWYTFYARARYGGEWSKIATVKSIGLANILYPMLREIYKGGEVKAVPGKDAKLEEEAQQ